MNKIQIIISNYDDIQNPYYGGGGAFAVHEVAKRLARRFTVTVLTGNYFSAKKSEVIDGIAYRRIGLSFVGPKLGQLLFHLALVWHVRRRSFDCWIESFTPPTSTSLLPLFTDKPVIGLVHMLAGEDMRRKYFLPFDKLETWGLQMYTQCIVTSELFRQKIIEKNPKIHVVVIPNGVNTPSLVSQDSTREYVLFLGRIEVDQKGLDLLLRAYSLARETIRIPLVIAGTGTENEMKKLHKLISGLGLEGSVQLVGKINGDSAKKELFQKAVVCVISSRFETFSIVALESMASSTPLIAFDIDGLRWIPVGVCAKIPPYDIDLLAQELIQCQRDAGTCRDLVNEGNLFVAHYDWDAISEKYYRYIRQVLTQQQRVT